MLGTHRAVGEHREPGSRQESDAAVYESLQQVAQRVHWIRMVTVQGHNNVTRRPRKPALVSPAIAAVQFRDDVGAHFVGNRCRPVGGTIVDARNTAQKNADELSTLTKEDQLLKLRDDICTIQKKYGLPCTVAPQ